jgi:tripartite tricarboxylate transporter family receptor
MRIFTAIVLGFVSFGVVHAQSYPTKPIRFIVPDAPGGSADLRARQIAPKLAEALAQAVVIDNKPGGNMIIGAEAAAKSPNDGYTIFLGNAGQSDSGVKAGGGDQKLWREGKVAANPGSRSQNMCASVSKLAQPRVAADALKRAAERGRRTAL